MELKEGMYVRTKDGLIDKVIIDYKGRCNSPNCTYKHVSCEHNYYDEENIIKASDNIIDLIEIGDYVNGMEVIAKDSDNRLYVPEDLGQPYDREFSNGCFEYTLLEKNFEIKSVVTKELFNSVKYEVE